MKRNDIEFDERYATEAGSRFKEQFHGVVNPDGTISLVSDGFKDVQAELESWEESTKIENIVARVEAGAIELLSATKGFFGDTVGLPTSYPEMVQMMYNANEAFMKLPLEVRDDFNNDLNQYIAQFGTKEFYEKVGKHFTKEPEDRSGSREQQAEKE